MQYRSRLHEFCLEYISLCNSNLKITLKGLGLGSKNLPSAHFIPLYNGTNAIICNLLLLPQYFLYFFVMHLGRFSWFCCRRNVQNLINYQWKCNLNGLEVASEKTELMHSQQLVTSHKIVKKYYHYTKTLMYISGLPTSINLKHGKQFQMTVFQCQVTKTQLLNQFQVTEISQKKVITKKLHMSMNREPLLNVSTFFQSHLLGVPIYTKRHIQH